MKMDNTTNSSINSIENQTVIVDITNHINPITNMEKPSYVYFSESYNGSPDNAIVRVLKIDGLINPLFSDVATLPLTTTDKAILNLSLGQLLEKNHIDEIEANLLHDARNIIHRWTGVTNDADYNIMRIHENVYLLSNESQVLPKTKRVYNRKQFDAVVTVKNKVGRPKKINLVETPTQQLITIPVKTKLKPGPKPKNKMIEIEVAMLTVKRKPGRPKKSIGTILPVNAQIALNMKKSLQTVI